MMMSRSIHQEDTIIVNTYAPNIEIPKCIKQILSELKGEIDNTTIIVEDFNTLFSTTERSSIRKPVSKQQV